MIRGRRFLVKRVNFLWCRQVDKRLEWYHGYGLALYCADNVFWYDRHIHLTVMELVDEVHCLLTDPMLAYRVLYQRGDIHILGTHYKSQRYIN